MHIGRMPQFRVAGAENRAFSQIVEQTLHVELAPPEDNLAAQLYAMSWRTASAVAAAREATPSLAKMLAR